MKIYIVYSEKHDQLMELTLEVLNKYTAEDAIRSDNIITFIGEL